MCQPFQFDLPESFIKRHRPIRPHREKFGLSAYLFDVFGLEFYRNMATAAPVTSDAVWSVMTDVQSASMYLQSGELSTAIGYLVTEVPQHSGMSSSLPLPKRLTYRQKTRLAIIRTLLLELSEAPVAVPADVIEFIESRMRPFA